MVLWTKRSAECVALHVQKAGERCRAVRVGYSNSGQRHAATGASSARRREEPAARASRDLGCLLDKADRP